MRIVIEVEGEKVTAIGSDAVANAGDALPGPAPAALLARAKQLGAMSAGAAQFGIGAALAATAPASETPQGSPPPRGKRAAKRRGRRSR